MTKKQYICVKSRFFCVKSIFTIKKRNFPCNKDEIPPDIKQNGKKTALLKKIIGKMLPYRRKLLSRYRDPPVTEHYQIIPGDPR